MLVHENAGRKIIDLEEPKCIVDMKICDLYGFFRPLGGPQHPTTAALMLVYDVTLPVGADLMEAIYNGMTNYSAGPKKLFWPPNIPKVIVASKMDLFDPEKHKVNLQRGLAFATEKIAHFYTSTLDPRSVYEAFKYLANEYAKLHIPKGQLTMDHVVMHGSCESGKFDAGGMFPEWPAY